MKADWGKRYGAPGDTYPNRKSKTKLEQLAQTIGADGHHLLAAIYQVETPTKIKSLFTVEVLRRIWVQQYYLEDGQSHWQKKDDQGFPTSGQMIASPDDLDAPYSSKNGASWTGYKLHLTETCDPDEPRLITQVTTTIATVPDSTVTAAIKSDLMARSLSPETHWVDAGYVNTDNLLSSRQNEIDLLCPARADSSWQARLEGGYDQTQFSITTQFIRTVTCRRHRDDWVIGRTWWPLVPRGNKACMGRKVNQVGGERTSTFFSVARSAFNVRLAKNVLAVKRTAAI